MVIDMLNIPTQIRLQHEAFGGLSDQIQDYEGIRLAERIDSDRGRDLLEMVDPYSYRTHLTQPKLILLGTNDRYWPLDALSAYWDALPEPKRVLYVPNQGHSMKDLQRVVGALSALHRYSARDERLPSVSWAFSASPKDLEVSVQAEGKPSRVVFWSANSATQDFREASWSSHRCRTSGSRFLCNRAVTPAKFTAGYSEVTFSEHGQPDFSLSTAVCIVDAAGAMPRPCLNNSSQARTVPPLR
jgi:PhoPQ-activated pathogenicity-related protein